MERFGQVAVDYLVDNLKKTLYLEKDETVPVYELLSVVAAQYNMTAEHYCEVGTAPRTSSLVLLPKKPYRETVGANLAEASSECTSRARGSTCRLMMRALMP